MSDFDEIRQLHFDYVEYADKGDGDAFTKLFTPDGIWIVSRGNEFRGRQVLSDLIKVIPHGGWHKAGEVTHITIDGNTATGGCKYEAKRDGEHVFGRYEDRYIRTEDGWCFEYRKAISETITSL
jgi:uncharacterized protein (TIGR02246 family)